MKVPKSPEEVEVEAVFGFHADLSGKQNYFEEWCLCVYSFSSLREESTIFGITAV